MEEQENIVLYDWLSFTSKKHTPEELIQALGLTHCPWQETKGAHGYRDRKYFSCISVHYNGREDMGVWVELSGQGCRTFESLSSKSWDDLFQWITAQQLKITRLDVAFDDHTGVLDIAQIVEDTRQQHYVSRSDYWETVLSSKGSTVQIGSPKSKVLVRVYDKAAERHCEPGTHWIRVELQLRDDRAAQFCKLPMTDYWVDMLELVTPIRIYTAPGMDYNIDRCREYVVNQAGNAIDALLQIYGIQEFQRMIKERPTVENPKYTRLVQQYKFDRLSALAERYLGL